MLAVAATVAGLGLAGALAQPASAQEKIKLIWLPFSESLGAVIAEQKGFFKAEGIELETTKVPGAALALPILQAGRADIILSNTVSTLQALEQGMDATLLAPSAVVRRQPPDSTTAIMVLKGTAKSPRDLAGKRIAVNVVNSTAWLYAVGLLDKYGVSRDQVRFVEIGFPNMNAPLLNKQVDAISQVEPFNTILMGTGKVEVIGWSYVETQPNADVTQYIALTSWVREHHDLAVKFARAVIKGSKVANSNEAETREINQKFTGLNPALKDKVKIPLFGEAVNGPELQKTADLMLKYGLLKKRVDISGRVLKVD
ncbi:MAG: hypothetical protein A2V78_00595 [Betaproteobacteria bacterium RBG_16_64_18]|nr:MAG: hypothetical protein A2V78_00595 [Betaproteobacteria bacterium RBG_16_64_18]